MSAETSIFEKKLILTALALGCTALMLWTGKIDPSTYENVFVWLCGVFVLGEASSDWAKWFMSSKGTPAQ